VDTIGQGAGQLDVNKAAMTATPTTATQTFAKALGTARWKAPAAPPT
jgi:hypothetical protein